MWATLFIEPDDRIVSEQNKLIIKSAASQFVPSLLGFGILYALTLNEKNALLLSTWFACTLLILIYSNYLIRRTLKKGLDSRDTRRLAYRIIVSNFLFSLHWVSFMWIALSNLTSFSTYLAMTANTALMALYLGTTTPIYLAYLIHGVVAQLGISLKLTLLGEPFSKNTWWYAGLILGFFMGIAYKQNRATRHTIQLQLEKQDLLRDLAEQNEKVRQAQRVADDANQAKSRFLAAASHDIRQPIHALGLFLDILRHGDLSAHQEKILRNANSAFKASTEMLDTLLDFSRLESGTIQTNCRTFDLQPLLNKLETEFVPQTTEKKLIFRLRDTRFAVYSDPFLLELILRNLIGNAIRYTDHGGILIGARRRNERMSLEIWDTGMGIQSHHQADIFREFYRLSHNRIEQRKGLGLGLAIAQGFARALGHQITFNSRFKHGSVFRIEMPITLGDGRSINHLPPSSILTRMEGKVLLIEDDEDIRFGMEKLLHLWGCECHAAVNIEDALSSAQFITPDLIISDFSLSEPGNGIEAIQLLRHRHGRMIPAIVISGDTSQEQLKTTQAHNILFFSKPINTNLLHQSMYDLFKENQRSNVSLTTILR